jgi:hypothetical protein
MTLTTQQSNVTADHNHHVRATDSALRFRPTQFRKTTTICLTFDSADEAIIKSWLGDEGEKSALD